MISLAKQVPLRELAEENVLLLLGNRVHTVQKEEKHPDKYFKIENKKLYLGDFIDFSIFERQAIDKGKNALESKLQDSLASKKSFLFRKRVFQLYLEDSLKAMKDSNFEEYIIHNIIGGYITWHNPATGIKIKSETKSESLETPKNLENIYKSIPIISTIFPDSPVLINKNNIIIFQQANKPVKNHLKYYSMLFNPSSTMTLDEFLTHYDEKYNALIDEVIQSQTAQLSSKANEAVEEVSTVKKLLARKKQANKMQREKKRIWYEKQSDSSYMIYLGINPFIMVKDNVDYYFKQPVIVETNISFSEGMGFLSEPRIHSPSKYHHPFVYSDRRICFNAGKVLTDKGIIINGMKIKNLQDTKFARNVVKTILEAEYGLKAGYVNGVTPVTDLNPTMFSANLIKGFIASSSIRKYYQDGEKWVKK